MAKDYVLKRTIFVVSVVVRVREGICRKIRSRFQEEDMDHNKLSYASILAGWLCLCVSTSVSAADFLDGYQVRRGDFNNDGQTDLFVSPARRIIILPGEIDIPIAVQPVRDFVLQYRGDGTFAAITPTAAQSSALSQWPEAAVRGWLHDVDYDGHVDLELTKLNTVIPGAFDQFIFAPPEGVGFPARITAQNLKFQHYYEQVTGWLFNNNYFEDNAPLKIVGSEPAGRAWFASLLDSGNISLMNLFLQRCRAETGNTCAISNNPPPSPCVRTVGQYDDAGVYVGTGTVNICSYSVHVIMYPQTITVVKDYSRFDADARETAEVLERLKASCPNFWPADEDRLYRIEDIVWQHTVQRGIADTPNQFSHTEFPGDSVFPPIDTTYHHYDVYTKVCDLSEPNCNVSTVRDQALRHFSLPHRGLRSLYTEVPGGFYTAYVPNNPFLYNLPSNYTREAGPITQRWVGSGRWTQAIQNVTEVGHLVYPGTISRYVDVNHKGAKQPRTPPVEGSALYVFTHGVGLNRFQCRLNEPSRALHVIIGLGNDVLGQKGFARLDEEMIKWWRQRYNPTAVETPPPFVGPTNAGPNASPIE